MLCFAFPYLLLAIVIAFLLSDKIGQGIITAAIAITVVYVPQYFRVVRNHVISIREESYVEAARALGAPRRTIIRRYVLANVIQNVPALATSTPPTRSSPWRRWASSATGSSPHRRPNGATT